MAHSEISLFQELLALANAGHMASLQRLVQRRSAWLLDRAPAPRHGEPYGRLPLHRNRHGEVMLAGWHNGARCAPHDHGEARGMVVVVAGRFRETRYRHTREGLQAHGAHDAADGSAIPVSHRVIHDMRCDQAGATLHVYVPTIDRMRVYDALARTTWIVNDAGGAWIPRDGAHVIGTEPWVTSTGALASRQ